MKLTTKTKILCGALALGLGAANSANASVSAQAFIDMTGFVIRDASTQAIIDVGTDVTINNTSNSGGLDVSLSGVQAAGSPYVTSDTNYDPAPLCIGGGCPVMGDNTFPVLTSPPVVDYVAGDLRDSGSPVSSFQDPNAAPGVFLATPADVSIGTWGGLATGTGDGSAAGDNTLGSQFVFTATTGGPLQFDFDIRTYIEAQMTGDESAPATANASTIFNFKLTELNTGNVLLNFQPAGALNSGLVQILAPTFGGADQKTTGGYHTTGVATTICANATAVCAGTNIGPVLSGALTAGNTYQLDAEMKTSINVVRLPEPGTMLLFGLGALGLGAARRRKIAR